MPEIVAIVLVPALSALIQFAVMRLLDWLFAAFSAPASA